MRRLLCILALALVAASCQNKVREEFLASADICLEENGKVLLTYDPLTCQLSRNTEKMQYRIMDDTMSRYYMLTLRSMPETLGQKIIADLRWSTGVSIQDYSALEFTVEKIESGQVWLWNSRRKIAVSIIL